MAAQTVSSTAPGGTIPLRLYFLRHGKLAAAGRDVPPTAAVAGAAVDQLLAGPTSADSGHGLSSALPSDAKVDVEVKDGTATIRPSRRLDHAGLAQLVYTLTQLPGVKRVALGQGGYTRANFEDLAPLILIESPLPGAAVSSPVLVRGTSDTFEGTVQLEVDDSHGKVLGHVFTTATSGSGTRGTFSAKVPFSSATGGPGKVVGYEDSAANGRRIHVYEVPVELQP
jgi:hypothetical protein